MFSFGSFIITFVLLIGFPAFADDAREKNLWKNIRQFEVKLANLKEADNFSQLSTVSDGLWQSYSGSVVTPCTRTAGTLVQYFKTRRDGGTASDLEFHFKRYAKARARCLKTLKLDPKKYPMPRLSLVP